MSVESDFFYFFLNVDLDLDSPLECKCTTQFEIIQGDIIVDRLYPLGHHVIL